MYYIIDDNNNVLIAASRNALVDYGCEIKILPADYDAEKYIVVNGNLIIDPDYEEKQKQKERERIQALFMTRSDFFDGMIKAFGVNAEELLIVVENILATLPIQDIEKKIAVNNYKNALNFYRKHALFTLLSNVEIQITPELTIVITPEQWDTFFDETNKRNPNAYKALLPPEESVEEEPEENIEEPEE